MVKSRPKVAVLYPAFMAGGAEAVCLWMLEALQDEYDLTVLTYTRPDWASLNELYGTDLSLTDIKVITLTPEKLTPLLKYFWGTISPLHPWRQHFLMRFYKQIRSEYALTVSGYNEMDFGKAGIQYVHSPQFVLGQNRHKLISNYSDENMKRNITLTCSQYIADSFQEMHGVSATVLYPPVGSTFPEILWEEKEMSFICYGRMAPEKKLDQAVDIIRRVRKAGWPVSLKIIGTATNKKYVSLLEAQVKRHSDWLSIHKDPNRENYNRLLAQSRYAIHLRVEGFGIAIAEMIKAGCIPLVRDFGGQTEIVGDIPQLKFGSDDEAVEKIICLLGDELLQSELRKKLATRKALFSQEKFQEQFRETVAGFFRKTETVAQ